LEVIGIGIGCNHLFNSEKLKHFFLVTITCLITQIIFASLQNLTVIEMDSSFLQLSGKAMHLKKNEISTANAINTVIIKPARFKGGKLNFRERISCFLIKHKIIKTNPNRKSDFNFWGLLLGVTLGPLGVLVAYISSKKKSLRKWSVVGCVTDIGLGILFLITIILVIGAF
jgi:hypothetical protein